MSKLGDDESFFNNIIENDKKYKEMNIKISCGVIPQIGKHYLFLSHGFLKIGICIKNPSQKPTYDWVMKGVDDGKIYYPYCLDIIDTDIKIQEIIPTFKYEDL